MSEYLTFTLGDQEYGVDILNVQEIRGQSAVTPIPNAPPHVRGVSNLRGVIIPVIDLRARLGLPQLEPATPVVTIVAHLGKKIVGLLADAVSDVVKVSADDVQPAPDFGADVDARFIEGLAMAGDKLVVLLDIASVVGNDAVSLAAAASAP